HSVPGVRCILIPGLPDPGYHLRMGTGLGGSGSDPGCYRCPCRADLDGYRLAMGVAGHRPVPDGQPIMGLYLKANSSDWYISYGGFQALRDVIAEAAGFDRRERYKGRFSL